jgi:undecaprenyl-diphosphatase
LCGYVVVQIFRRTTNWSWRFASVCVALAVVALVAFSRVYLGVHHPSDVLAAVLLGVAWLCLCLSGEQWLGRRTRCATL